MDRYSTVGNQIELVLTANCSIDHEYYLVEVSADQEIAYATCLPDHEEPLYITAIRWPVEPFQRQVPRFSARISFQ